MHIHTVVNALQLRKSIISKELDSRWLKYMPGWQEIPLNIQASRELYKNLFEAPLPFLVYCLFAYTVDHVTILNLVLAWLYVALDFGITLLECLIQKFQKEEFLSNIH